MTASRSQTVRQSLQLSIDTPSYNTQEVLISPESNSPSSSSARASVETAGTTPASGGSEWTIYSVLCMYDFQSSDPDHLPFNKNEILDIVKQEETGWWAAMRRGGEVIGWIPQAFVKPLSKEMTERLRNVREELRVYEYDAEQLYNSAPISRLHQLYESDPEASPTPPNPGGWNDEDANVRKRTVHPIYLPITDQTPSTQPITPTDRARDLSQSVSPSAPGPGLYITPPDSQRSTGENRPRPYPPPSPSTPMPQPPLYTAPINKPTPPTPTDSHETLQRSHYESSSPGLANGRSIRRRPMLVDDRVSLSRLSTLMESNNVTEVDKLASPDSTGSFDALTRRPRAEKIKQITGSEDALAFHNAVRAQASLPTYLRPSYSDQLQVDNEGQVRFGTLPALVEKLSSDTLTKDPIKMAQETTFRNIFLMTFRNFTSADQLFDMLVERYRMDHPSGMTSAEFEEWKEKCLLPTQGRVLTVFTIWLEDHRLLEEEPQIAQRLTDFLALIVTPPPLALTAKLIVQSIERLTFNPINPSPTVSARRRRKSRAHKNDLLRLDPTDIAEQLCLLEYKLYAKVTPQECITYAKTQTGKSVANLCAFCSTHDKLASWVKTSILNNEALGKRADTVDFWIKVAEKCRNLNNFASMSALINALSSTVITRLHLTWAHVGRKSNLDALLKYNEPTGGFSGYRSLLLNVEGSCVPFIGMYLTDIVHIQDQFSDDGPLLCFLQRQRLYEVVTVMLRYQSRPYNIAESESMQNFVSAHLHTGSLQEQGWFWTRSQEVQQSELAHADIRKGLEAAGF